MKPVIAFLRLIRWPNLLIVFFTQLLIWGCLVAPLNSGTGTSFAFLNFPHFLLLSSSVIFIAAGGYIINDIYDVKIDLINKPQKVIIGSKIAAEKALGIYFFLNLMGLVIAAYLCFLIKKPFLFLIQLLSITLLWSYAYRFKKSYAWGNITVAFLTALTVLILIFYDPFFLQFATGKVTKHSTEALINLYIILGYAYFAFMTTWVREIVKDLQDIEGDNSAGCQTIPIVSGSQTAIRWIQVIAILIVLPLLFLAGILFLGKGIILSLYILSALIIPLIFLIAQIAKSQLPTHFQKISRNLKFIMLAGLLGLIVFYCLFYENR